MLKAERHHGGGSDWLSLKVCVFLRQNFPNQAHTVSTSLFPGFISHRTVNKASGEVRNGMCSDVYLYAVQ
jgi:hypothetical protein